MTGARGRGSGQTSGWRGWRRSSLSWRGRGYSRDRRRRPAGSLVPWRQWFRLIIVGFRRHRQARGSGQWRRRSANWWQRRGRPCCRRLFASRCVYRLIGARQLIVGIGTFTRRCIGNRSGRWGASCVVLVDRYLHVGSFEHTISWHRRRCGPSTRNRRSSTGGSQRS